MTFCWSCGAFGSTKLVALSGHCRRLADTDKRRRRLRAGLTPCHGVEWPEPEEVFTRDARREQKAVASGDQSRAEAKDEAKVGQEEGGGE